MGEWRVAMVGTFDVANFGDLLFPLVADHELRARLGRGELVRYSYTTKETSAWPYDVRPLASLPDEIASFGLVLVGGGHLLRHDHAVARGYVPEGSGVHQPTGLWLGPSVTAAGAGVPVAWNALGASATWPEPAGRLLAAAARLSGHVAVRDEVSMRALAAVGISGRRVPDTALGVGALLRDRTSPVAGSPYVVVQPTLALAAHLEVVRAFRDAAHAAGRRVVELPIGPVHGDRPGVLGRIGDEVIADLDPLATAAVIAGADAVLGISLHLALVAAAHGVPVHRPVAPAGTKWSVLRELPAVHEWGTAPRSFTFDAVTDDRGRRWIEGELSRHWDAVAALVGAAAADPTAALVELATLAPLGLDTGPAGSRRPSLPAVAHRVRAAVRRRVGPAAAARRAGPSVAVSGRPDAALDAVEARTVWILGGPRTGSSWLLHQLGRLPDVAMVDEPNFGLHLAPWRTSPIAPLSGYADGRLRYNDLLGTDPDYCLAPSRRSIWHPALRTWILETVRSMVPEGSTSTIVLKEPNGSQGADVLGELLPGARLLVLVRDGRDVVDSVLDAHTTATWWSGAPYNVRLPDASARLEFIRHHAWLWVERAAVVRRAFDAHDPSRRQLVRYEDLRADPLTEIGRLATWLGRGDAAAVRHAVEREDFDAIPAARRGPTQFARSASPGSWRQAFDDEEQRVLHEVMGRTLADLGYEVG